VRAYLLLTTSRLAERAVRAASLGSVSVSAIALLSQAVMLLKAVDALTVPLTCCGHKVGPAQHSTAQHVSLCNLH
jgi:hypothetical protein